MAKGTRTFGYQGETWKVFTAPGTHRYLKKDVHGGPYAGKCMLNQRRIYIRADLSPALYAETLVHEFMHVVDSTVVKTSDLNEAIVAAWAPGLAEILTQLVTGLER